MIDEAFEVMVVIILINLLIGVSILTLLSLLYILIMATTYNSLDPRKINEGLFKEFYKEIKKITGVIFVSIFVCLTIGIIILKVFTEVELIISIGGSVVLYTIADMCIVHWLNVDENEKENLAIINKSFLVSLNIANISYSYNRWDLFRAGVEKVKPIIDAYLNKNIDVQKLVSLATFAIIMLVVFTVLTVISYALKIKRKDKKDAIKQ